MFAPWLWTLLKRHLSARNSRPAIKWMTYFAFISVAAGVWAWISVISIMEGLQNDIRQNVLKEKAHLIWEGTPKEGIGALKNKIQANFSKDISDIQFNLETEGLMEPLESGAYKLGSGVVIKGDISVPRGMSAIGLELAEMMRLFEGDRFNLRSVWKLEGVPLNLAISSIDPQQLKELDRWQLRVNKEELEEWLGLSGYVSKIEIKVNEPYKVENIQASLSKSLGVPLKSWKEVDAAHWYSLKLEKIAMSIALFFVVILAALAVHFALSVRVTEKRREIALLMALGASVKKLFVIYLLEGVFIGVLGAAFGLASAYITCLLVSKNLRLPDIYFSTQIPVKWDWTVNIMFTLLCILICVLASWGPARRISKTDIPLALRS